MIDPSVHGIPDLFSRFERLKVRPPLTASITPAPSTEITTGGDDRTRRRSAPVTALAADSTRARTSTPTVSAETLQGRSMMEVLVEQASAVTHPAANENSPAPPRPSPQAQTTIASLFQRGAAKAAEKASEESDEEHFNPPDKGKGVATSLSQLAGSSMDIDGPTGAGSDFLEALNDEDSDRCVELFVNANMELHEARKARMVMERSHEELQRAHAKVHEDLKVSQSKQEEMAKQFQTMADRLTALEKMNSATAAAAAFSWSDSTPDDEDAFIAPVNTGDRAVQACLDQLEETIATMPASIEKRMQSLENRLLEMVRSAISKVAATGTLPSLPGKPDTPAPSTEPPSNRTPTYAAAARKAVAGTALSQAELVRVAFQHRFDRTASSDRFRNVFAKFTIPKDLPRNRHRTFAREVLQAIGITDGIALISFIGRSVIHLVVAESYHEHVTQALN
ncbi:hypothetical protein HDU96_001889, partial [Phlyctochytrium bullatum]